MNNFHNSLRREQKVFPGDEDQGRTDNEYILCKESIFIVLFIPFVFFGMFFPPKKQTEVNLHGYTYYNRAFRGLSVHNHDVG